MPANASRLCVPGRKPEEASVFLSRGTSVACVNFTAKQKYHNLLRSKNRLLVVFLVKSLVDRAWSVALSCACPCSPGRIPGLKGVTNFRTGIFRIGVLRLGIGVMILASGVGTTAGRAEESSTAGLLCRAGVDVAGFKRDGRIWRFPGVLTAGRLIKGDLKGLREAFPLIFETEGVWNEVFPSALGVEKWAPERNVPPLSTRLALENPTCWFTLGALADSETV
jgi:hypothetical protein